MFGVWFLLTTFLAVATGLAVGRYLGFRTRSKVARHLEHGVTPLVPEPGGQVHTTDLLVAVEVATHFLKNVRVGLTDPVTREHVHDLRHEFETTFADINRQIIEHNSDRLVDVFVTEPLMDKLVEEPRRARSTG